MQTIDITSLAGKNIGEMLAALTAMQQREQQEETDRLTALVASTVEGAFECHRSIPRPKLHDMCVEANDGVRFPISVLEDYLRLGETDSKYEISRGKGGGVRVRDVAREARRSKLVATIAALQAELDGLGV